MTWLRNMQIQRPSERISSRTSYSYRRRRLLVEEVPGLYIRRLTLEDPRSATRDKEVADSRSASPARHICQPRGAHDRPGRGSSSYRSWLERIRNERPAYLTITSLELPESPIPLIESQASARSRGLDESPRSNSDRDVILDEFLEKVSRAGQNNDKSSAVRFSVIDNEKRASTARRRARDQSAPTNECHKELPSLEECTKRIIEGPRKGGMRTSDPEVFKDCICSEISENLRINIREKTEVIGGSRSPSPEVTHTIRIAMKYHGQPEHDFEGNGDQANNGRKRHERPRSEIERGGKDERSNKNSSQLREDSCCPGVNVALDFTLNCSSVQLTSRDISLRTGVGSTRNEKSHE